ncbi:GFA family protein [Salinispirillum marinum]|uniref:GFA family protein n=2 Tax=Saccharospirillaceae TaxID=255527 RepID=A0ABV8BG13_9GAMM
MLTGSCLCGQVTYHLQEEPTQIDLCHCSVCRKAHGSVLSAGSTLSATALQVNTGDDLLRFFESSPGKRRYFCANCGTHLFSRMDKSPDKVRLRVATLDIEPSLPQVRTLHLDSAVQWFQNAVSYKVPSA